MSATFDKCLHLCQVAERNSAVERRPGELCLVGASIEEQLDRVEAAEPGQNAKGGFLVAADLVQSYAPVNQYLEDGEQRGAAIGVEGEYGIKERVVAVIPCVMYVSPRSRMKASLSGSPPFRQTDTTLMEPSRWLDSTTTPPRSKISCTTPQAQLDSSAHTPAVCRLHGRQR